MSSRRVVKSFIRSILSPQMMNFASKENRTPTSWYVATGLLLVMIVLFLISLGLSADFYYRDLLKAFSEAAMVGAFADWFAVTALFRHPLGLPFPHTAIIPRNKERIATSFGSFIDKNFLDPEIARTKLASVDIAANFANWLSMDGNLERGVERLSSLSPLVSDFLKNEEVRRVFSEALSRPFSEINLSPFIGNLLKVVAKHPEFRSLADELINIFGELIEEQKGNIRQKVRQESPWYIPDFIDQKIYEKLVSQLRTLILRVKEEPKHPVRNLFFDKLSEWADRFIEDPEYHSIGNSIREEIVRSGVLSDAIGRIVEAIGNTLRSSSTVFSQTASSLLRGLSTVVGANSAVRGDLNLIAREFVVLVVSNYRSNLAVFISDVMRNWETKTLIDKIEDEIGSDLQFIRINGTLVGGAIGVILWFLEHLK